MDLYLGYADEGVAFCDALRMIVSAAFMDGTVEAIAGWGADAVILVPGVFGGFHTIRITSVRGNRDDVEPTPSGRSPPRGEPTPTPCR